MLPRLFAIALLVCEPCCAWAVGEGELEVTIVDKDTQRATAARMHLRDARNKPVSQKKAISWKDHFVIDGKLLLVLPPGSYAFEIERGPEYKPQNGKFTIEKNARDKHTIVMERFTSMAEHGWWSGDLHIHRPPADIESLMRAEDLHIAPVITWWNKSNAWADKLPEKPVVEFDGDRFYHLLAGEDEREGGALLFFNLPKPLPIQKLSREVPSGTKFIGLAREHTNAHIDIEKPFWWDMPVWIATGQVDSIGLANNHLWRAGGLLTEAWGKSRDKVFYPDPHGNGRWTQDIYYHLLNCGLQLPPSAGSASGVLDNPVGYNRVYVHCDGKLTWEAWWRGLREGKVVVTNGPLLRPRINGHPPGHVLSAAEGETVEMDISVDLASRDKIDYLEVVRDGKVIHEVRLADYAKSQGKLPVVSFDRSGWLLIRAVTQFDKSYRFGSTGPYYVRIGQQPRISKQSAQFFVDWVGERTKRIKIEQPDDREAVLQYHRAAQDYWKDLLGRANAE